MVQYLREEEVLIMEVGIEEEWKELPAVSEDIDATLGLLAAFLNVMHNIRAASLGSYAILNSTRPSKRAP